MWNRYQGKLCDVPKIKDFPCYKCQCKGDIVTCNHRTCTPIDKSCRVAERGQCCHECKSCRLSLKKLHHGESWASIEEPCRMHHCQAGVATQWDRVCYTPCSPEYQLRLPGYCCPRCFGCFIDNQIIRFGESARPFKDKRIQCRCENGLLTCHKDVCPVLNCPKDQQEPAEGPCFKCAERRFAQTLKYTNGICLLKGSSYPNRTSWSVDECTDCSCKNGTIICSKTNCPVLECSQKDHKKAKGNCCPTCQNDRICKDDSGKQYEHNEQWAPDNCSSCVCNAGQITCKRKECPIESMGCAPGYFLEKKVGACCANCVERFAACSILGKPLLRTFDASAIRFKGRCKYVLTKQCQPHLSPFTIRFVYKRKSRALLVSMQRYKLTIGTGFKIKVNGRKASISNLKSEIPQLRIAVLQGYIQLHLRNGIRIVWDGKNFLEIHAPRSMRGKLCGLCGNYNNNKNDDWIGENGEMFTSMEEFTRSWRKGFCKADHMRRSNCLLGKKQKRLVRMYCKKLKKLECAEHMNMRPYYNWCKEEMCACRTEYGPNCFCPILQTVLRRCARKKSPVLDLEGWPCGGEKLCPKGFQFTYCACSLTCSQLGQKEVRCPKQCRTGCVCKGKRLLHKGKCIKMKSCPKRFLRRLSYADRQRNNHLLDMHHSMSTA